MAALTNLSIVYNLLSDYRVKKLLIYTNWNNAIPTIRQCQDTRIQEIAKANKLVP